MRRNGYMFVDLLAGLALISIVTVSLTVVMVKQNQVANRLAELRATTAELETFITQLQLGAVPTVPADAAFSVRQIDDSPAVGARVWVEVTAKRQQRSVSLSGLIPQKSLTQWQQTIPAEKPAMDEAGSVQK